MRTIVQVAGISLSVTLAIAAFAATGANAIEWLVETATTMTGGESHWTDESTRQTMACFESTIESRLNSGLVAGTDIGKITMATWNKGLEECEATGSIKFKFRLTR